MLQTWRHQIPIGKQQFYKVPENMQVRKSQHEDQTRFKAEGKEHVAFIYTFIYKECPESDGASIYKLVHVCEFCSVHMATVHLVNIFCLALDSHSGRSDMTEPNGDDHELEFEHVK